MEHTKENIVQWFAGFYEGEGSISNDKGNNNRIRVSISQNDRAPLDIGLKIWGGFIRERIRVSPASDKFCLGHDWVLPHTNSIQFINDIKPFLLIPYKINQIKKVFDEFENGDKIYYECHYCDNIYANPSGRSRHEKHTHITKSRC